MHLQQAVEVVCGGGVLVYPTETLYAIGGDGSNPDVAARVYDFKQRDAAKPLPLVIGDISQLSLVTGWRNETLDALAEAFWPGPLSILVPCASHLPPQVSDTRGFTSVRVTPHPVAAALSKGANVPLIATSANISGCDACAVPHDLDDRLLAKVDGVLDVSPWPQGGAPSTVVGIESDGSLRVYRAGAVSLQTLTAKGFSPFLSPLS